MALITTADQRIGQDRGVKLLIVGPSKIGKTSLLWSLDPATTLVVDMEAGMLSVQGWGGDSIDVRAQAQQMGVHPWEFLRDLACLLSGPDPMTFTGNPRVDDAKPYSQAHFNYCQTKYGDRGDLFGKYRTVFFDSITQMARFAFSWSKTQPEAFSEKTGKPDNRGAYGLLGQIMVGGGGILGHLQHCPDKDIVLVGILDQKTDDYGRKHWTIQVDGGKTEAELPGIMDTIVSMVEMGFDGAKHRVFVCQKMNQWGYPAGERSGRLEMLEQPDLGKLIAKMKGGQRQAVTFNALPAAEPVPAAVAAEKPVGPIDPDIPF